MKVSKHAQPMIHPVPGEPVYSSLSILDATKAALRTSIRGEHPARSGYRKLQRALFLSAFAALAQPASCTYYDRRRAEGKKHNATIICLARRRCDVLYTVLKNHEVYRQPTKAAG
ncbi:transposase (plasmid) [Rhodococcus erythropolis R138]|nr:transposase [Rhodococcus erythropolis R138]